MVDPMYESYSACVWPCVGGSGAPSCGQYSNASGYLIWHWEQVFTARRSYRGRRGGSIGERLAAQQSRARMLYEIDTHRPLDVAHQEAAARRLRLRLQPRAVVAELVGEQ